MLKDLKQLLHTAAYYPAEIERILDPKRPSFVSFDPELGYLLKNYIFRDGMYDTLSSYIYEENGGYRKMINYADEPCRINTYGNSYTQCAQVSDGETWQEILAAHLREPIRNFGVGGYGIYQAYRRLLRTERTSLAASYIIFNIWDDDHYRNLDAARWIRVAWMLRDLPRDTGGKKSDEVSYPVHGFPWGHVRYSVKEGRFMEMPGYCKRPEDLRKLVGKDNYYEVFKDDTVAHLIALKEGGDAPFEELEKLAEAFGMRVNLRSKKTRVKDAKRLHTEYALRSTMYILDELSIWAEKNKRKLMIVLSYDVPAVREIIEKNTRFDGKILDYLKNKGFNYVDTLKKIREEHKKYDVTLNKFLEQFYVSRLGAQVFGHYNPFGNFWFAFSLRKELVDMLNPKPPAYR